MSVCLCRDQPAECVCNQREIEASERRQRVNRSMRFGLMVAAGMATPEPTPTEIPCGYDERDALV